jgi:Protein of unknown function (DUF3667)
MDDLGKSFPASEGLVDVEQGSEKKQANEFCLNCGTKLQDTFCHHCGQKDIPKRQTLGELWTNFISSFWSYEGKFLKTTQYIITRPGFLATEYTQGKRERYYHPARMYVFMSFVFFLLFFSLPDSDGGKRELIQGGVSKADSLELAKLSTNPQNFVKEGGLDSILQNIQMDSADRGQVDSARVQMGKKKVGNKNVGWSIDKVDYKTRKSYDSAQLIKSEIERDGWLTRNMMYKIIDLNEKYKGDWKKFAEDFKQSFNDNFSKVLFWLLPFFALLLKLLYIRRDYFYSEHLVFSIYAYNFFYLAGSIQMLIDLVPWLGWLATLMGFWIFFYLLFAMKRMYEQSWRKTILKFFLFVFIFTILLSIGFSISAFFIFLAF